MRSDQEQAQNEFHTTLTGAGERFWRSLSPALVERLIAEMPYSIAALDQRGVIIATNEAWRRFARENGAPGLADTSIGQDYLETCRRATGPFAEGASEAMLGIQAVLDGSRPLFTQEYPCPSPAQQRWFLLHVTPLPAKQRGAIISHIEIPRRRTEAEQTQALAIEAEARAKAEATARWVSQLQTVTDIALTYWDLPGLESALMEHVQRAMAIEYVWLMLASEDGRELVMRAARGLEDIAGVIFTRVPMDQGLMGRIALSREPLVVDDLSVVDSAYREFLERGEMRSLAGAPLLVGDRLVGILSVGSKKPRHFTPEDVDFLRLAGDRIALALEHARLDEIAQRAHAEAKARANQLAAIIDAITDPLYVFDRDGVILFQNTADRALMGLESGAPNPPTVSARGKRLELRDPQGRPLPMSQWPALRILQGETLHSPHTADLIIRVVDGRDLVCSVSGSPIQDAQGNIVGGVLVVRDVTERRRLERALEERADQLAAIVEAINDALVVFDREGNILFQNSADRAFLGLRPGEPGPRTYVARNEMLRISDLQGKPLPMSQSASARVLRGEALHGAHAMDVVYHRADGSAFVASLSGGPIRDAQGSITGAVLVARDVTERRAMERRARGLFEALLAMAEALVSLETSEVGVPGKDLAARRLAELTRDALGCERISITAIEPEELRTRAVVRLGWPPEDERRWYRESTRYRLTDLMAEPLIARLRAGETALSSRAEPWSGTPSPDAPKILVAPLRIGSSLIGVLGLDYGDTPHTYTEEEMAVASAVGKLAALVLERDNLLREREEAIASELASRQVQERMDEFLATATHDLRSPIASGKLAIQIARRRVERQLAQLAGGEAGAPSPGASIRTNMEIIERSMDRLAQLVDRLMDVSRVRAGKLELSLEPCDLRQIVRQAVEEQRLLAPDRALRLRLPARAVTVLADADRSGQVVTNFLTNALRYAPDSSPIDITLRVIRGQARLSVRDYGPGIRAEEQAGIWERFQQTEHGKGAAAKSGGLGLGLYISREIIRLHGGQVGVRSVPGQGATFWFSLPLAEGADSASPSPATTPG